MEGIYKKKIIKIPEKNIKWYSKLNLNSIYYVLQKAKSYFLMA